MVSVREANNKVMFPGAGAREVLNLDGCKLLFSGGRRLVYQHPEKDHLLIKVIRPDRLKADGEFKAEGNKLRIKLNRRFGPYVSFVREVREMTRAARGAHFSSLAYPFPYLYGFVYTNLGLGIVIEKIVDSSGNAAPTMRQLIIEGKFTAVHHARFHEFFDICEKHHYILGDITSANLVYRDQDGGTFICIDGTGEKALIPVHEWFCWANEWKLKRSRTRMDNEIRKHACRQVTDAPATA
jgi:hypothetical protein